MDDTPQKISLFPDENVAPPRTAGVEFSGKAGEFFGIWIVNILLTIVTLGIYSAWAKVRTQQYFYSNTSIEDHRFEYLANPIQILKGRLLAVALFGLYFVCVSFFPVIGMLFILGLLFLSPWLINQGLRFQCRMTSYRNVRFSFAGNYGDAFVTFILLPIVGLFTLYLAMPWVLKKMDEYIYSNISYGDKPLKPKLDTGEYYATCLIIMALTIGFAVFAGIVVAIIGGSLAAIGGGAEAAGGVVGVLMMIVYVGMYGLLGAVYQARIRNHLFNNAEIEDVTTFESKVEIAPFAVLLLVNSLAIVFSLGLAYPWAKIRVSDFLAKATTLELKEGADGMIDTLEEQESSFAEEAGEIFDVDISLT